MTTLGMEIDCRMVATLVGLIFEQRELLKLHVHCTSCLSNPVPTCVCMDVCMCVCAVHACCV